MAAAAGSALVPSAVELLWTDPPAGLRVGVLLEGTPSGVAERARQMAELLAGAGATPAVATSETPFRWWEPEPGARPERWSGSRSGCASSPRCSTRWPRPARARGIRPAVSGPAGAGVLYAWLDPGVADEMAARFVRALRDRLEGVFAGSADGSGLLRGSVAVLAAPTAVLAAAGADRPVPGLDLMRAVKDQFDPGHRMCPGRFPWGR